MGTVTFCLFASERKFAVEFDFLNGSILLSCSLVTDDNLQALLEVIFSFLFYFFFFL